MTIADITLAAFVLQQPSRCGLRPSDHQGGQGSKRRGSHLVWDVAPFPPLACVGSGVGAREQRGLDHGFHV